MAGHCFILLFINDCNTGEVSEQGFDEYRKTLAYKFTVPLKDNITQSQKVKSSYFLNVGVCAASTEGKEGAHLEADSLRQCSYLHLWVS